MALKSAQSRRKKKRHRVSDADLSDQDGDAA